MNEAIQHGIFRRSLGALVLAILLTLGGCDGGIFGTGDGSDVQEMKPGEHEADAMPGGNSNGPGDQDLDSQITDNIATLEFDNLLNSGGQVQPAVRLINLTAVELNVHINLIQVAPLYLTPVASQQIGEPVPVPLGENTLTIRESSGGDTLFSFSPFNAGEASVTTLIARASPSNEYSVLALRTLTRSNMPSAALLRIVQVYPLDETDTRSTFTLEPQGNAPGSAQLSFPDIAASSEPDSAYSTVGAGEYQLTDSLARFEPVRIALSAGDIYTLLIVDREAPTVVLLQDNTPGTAQ